MSDQLGQCGLCHQIRELCDSHLLPAAAYKLSREPSRKNPNPVVIAKDRASTTSHQVTAYFLCQECEDRFSRNGERYVLRQCARRDGEFRLRQLLSQASPFCTDEKFSVFKVSKLLGEKVEQYLYFAASVFWRAGVRSWQFEDMTLERISLGTTYQEQLRLYLLGKAPFPGNGRIFVHVWSNERVDFTTVFPCTYRVELVRRHKFCIPGILFIFFLGRDVPGKHDMGTLNSSVGRFMWMCCWQDDSLFEGFLSRIKDSKRTGSLARRKSA